MTSCCFYRSVDISLLLTATSYFNLFILQSAFNSCFNFIEFLEISHLLLPVCFYSLSHLLGLACKFGRLALKLFQLICFVLMSWHSAMTQNNFNLQFQLCHDTVEILSELNFSAHATSLTQRTQNNYNLQFRLCHDTEGVTQNNVRPSCCLIAS